MEIERLRERWERARAGVLELVGRLEASDLTFRPFAASWDVGTLVRHIAHEEEIEVTWGLRRALPEPPAPPAADASATPGALLELLQRAHEGTRAYLAGLADGDLDTAVETAWGERGRLGDYLLHTYEHELHHRGELSLILGMLGRGGIDG